MRKALHPGDSRSALFPTYRILSFSLIAAEAGPVGVGFSSVNVRNLESISGLLPIAYPAAWHYIAKNCLSRD